MLLNIEANCLQTPDQSPVGFKRSVIFTYAISHLAQKDKVRFYYALKGRDGKSGITKRLRIEQLAKTALLVHDADAQQVRDFLNYWKCSFKEKEVWTRD
ncbi:MAG: hypothetical protein AABY13_04055 [Nanoarchaeota archaeon]